MPNTMKTFKYSFPAYTQEKAVFKLEVPIQIPYDGCTTELVHRVIKMFRIPDDYENDLCEKLSAFVSKETENYHHDRDEKLLNQLKNNEIDIEGTIKNWEKLFKENVVEFAEQKGTSDEEVFAAAYHKLVHSPVLDVILQVENMNANVVAETLRNRDEDIKKLTHKQTEEMEEKVRLLNTSTTEEEINELAARHFEEHSLVAGRWGSQLDAVGQTQRAQHRSWLMHTLEEYQSASALSTPSNSPLGTFSLARSLAPAAASRPRLEESFTIHLGSQLKQTHNIRILATDMVDLFARDHHDNATDASRRLQTSLGLYSSELWGAVLLCDSDPARPTPPTSLLVAAAKASTEYHFPEVDHQLRTIVEKVKEPGEKRNSERFKEEGVGGGSRSRARRPLQTGDVFITRHSNLAEVHVVFHLMADDSSLKSEITSRHRALLGLRGVLRAASCNDVTALSIPLLLRHELSEEMTASWCVRRAELVLKCVKGFMLEAAGWGGAELRTLQLTVPAALDDAVFASLAHLVPTIFRISNPVKFKASA